MGPSPVNFSGLMFQPISYTVDKETGRVNYEEMEEKARAERPKLIIAGASAYSREWDYARIRKLDADGDFSRTNRQRKVITALLDAYRDTNLSSALSLLEQVLPLITTDMTDREILGYAVSLFPLMTGGEVVSQHIPAAGTYASRNIDGMAVLVADLEANRQVLKDTLGG